MKKLFTFIICLAIYGIANATDVSGNISVNTTWDLAGSPYIVTGTVTVDAGITLTIESGVDVKFNNGTSLYVEGTVNATSTTFTSNDPSPSPGIWGYIWFYSGSTSTFTNCDIEYGHYIDVQSGASYTMSGGTIKNMYYYGISNSGTLNVSNAIIDLTGYVSYGYGIYTYSTSVTSISNTSILNCNYGIHIQSDDSQITIDNCTLSSNEYPLYFSSTGDLTVTGTNTFTGNTYNVFYVYPSAMSTDWNLPLVTVPYYFRTSFSVNNGSTFTIVSENILKFNSGLYISGTFTANAGVGENIYFTSHLDDNWGGDSNGDGTATAPAVGNWTGIIFNSNSNDASVMRRCKVRYAGNQGGITLYNASPTIEYCDLSQNYYGVYLQGTSSPEFNYNTIGSSSYTPIVMSFEANPSFIDNVLSFSDNQYDAIGLLGGTLTADAHLVQRDFTTIENITYLMLNEITIPASMTLTIDKGLVIKSLSYYYEFTVNGTLIADANADSTIVFTSYKDDNHGNPGDTNKDGSQTSPTIGDWGGFVFAPGSSSSSILDSCLIKYASLHNIYYFGQNVVGYAISIINADPQISNCEIKDVNYGIGCFFESDPQIFNNNMINITYTPFAISGTANPVFSGNVFTNVGWYAMGLIGGNVITNGTIFKRDLAGYSNITYVLLASMTIDNGSYLEVEPGVVIKMYGGSYSAIHVDGGFRAIGSATENIVFTSLYDDNEGNPEDTNGDGSATPPSNGDWYYIYFDETSDDSYCRLDSVLIKYPRYGVYFDNASGTVSNSTLTNASYYGVYCDGISEPNIDTVIIQNCSSDPIAMSLKSDPVFTDIAFAANFSSGIRILEGNLSSDATLRKRDVAGINNIAYLIHELSISTNATLTIEPGVVLKLYYWGYHDYGWIYIYGNLFAVGTETEKIVFTSYTDDSSGGDTNNDGNGSSPAAGDWEYIQFINSNIDTISRIKHCEIRYPRYGLTFQNTNVLMDSCTIEQVSNYGVEILGSANPTIQNCNFYNINSSPVYMSMFAEPVFSGNTALNVNRMAIDIAGETYSQSDTIPLRSFAGYDTITYYGAGMTINSGTEITIPAGAVFKDSYFTVKGKLNVLGTEDLPVVFTDSRDDDYGNPPDMNQDGSATQPSIGGTLFNFYDVSDDAGLIEHAIVRYKDYCAIMTSASPTFRNTLIENGNYGFNLNGVSEPAIDTCTFFDLTYTPLYLSLVSYPSSTLNNVISGTTHKGMRVINETLAQDVTLEKHEFGGIENLPYMFYSYTIGTGATLTIKPGVVCKSYGGYITVNKGLIAEGGSSPDSTIVFTSYNDDFFGGDTNADSTATSPDIGNWGGITFNNQSLDPLCRFKNCVFRYMNKITTNSASPSFENCSFTNSLQGIYATASSNPIISYCDFDNLYDYSSYYAINNVNQAFTINAENCWWGDNSGPTHSGNPGGTGERVTDGVDYDPWLTNGANNPMMGDVSLNGYIQAYDASLVLKHTVGIITLNSKQLGVAEVSGNGSVTAYDASLILQYIVGLISNFPAELKTPLPNFVSEVELIVGNEAVEPGEEFNLSLSIADVSGVYAMQMTIKYNQEFLEALEIESMLPGMNVTYDIDPEKGLIHISFAGIESLESDMTIANIVFKASDEITMGVTTPVTAKFFMANETGLTWNVSNGSVSINGFATGFENEPAENNRLLFCYPNPFTDNLNIKYTVPVDGDFMFIAVYNMYGQKVAEIINSKHSEGTYTISWNGNGLNGKKLTRGTYFIRLIAGGKTETQKIQVVK